MPTHAIYWLKRDFRLLDNPALSAALEVHDAVTPLFILEPSALVAPETSELHVHAQCDAFNGLYAGLGTHMGDVPPLGFSHREVLHTLTLLHRASPFNALVSHRETGGRRTYDRDKAVAKWCRERGVNWVEHQQTGVFRGPVDRDERHRDWDGFYKTPLLEIPGHEDLLKLKIPDEYGAILKCPSPVASEVAAVDLPPDKWMVDGDLLGLPQPGPLQAEQFGFALTAEQRLYVQPVNERAAGRTLHSFLHERGLDYSKGMSSPNTAFYRCSRLSVHLAWGTISGRTVFQKTHAHRDALQDSELAEAGTWRRNLRSFLSRLHWRDHFTQRLETEVEMEHRPLNPNFWELDLERDSEKLNAWIEGRTGFPMVDACIRCMATTGYVNFRMRAMLTSTATHMLHLDFRQIDKLMARLYTDYHPGIHLAQLQMQAGMVGINTLRTYSPEKQFTDHDPDAEFVHRWIPELRGYTAKEISKRNLEEGLGGYPAAIVDRTERIRTYKQLVNDLKFRPGGREITALVFDKHGSRRGPRRKKKSTKAGE